VQRQDYDSKQQIAYVLTSKLRHKVRIRRMGLRSRTLAGKREYLETIAMFARLTQI
jgi:hypothetical protein